MAQRDENLRMTDAVNVDANLVIFGETDRIENDPSFLSEPIQNASGKAGPYAVRRDKGSAEAPSPHVDRLELREFVAINGMRKLRKRSGQGQHGNLHHCMNRTFAIDYGQCIRVDQIFGIVQHDSIEVTTALPFELHHPSEDIVKAIRLRCRPGPGTHSDVDVSVRSAQFPGYCERSFDIGVNTKKNIVISVLDDRQIVANHVGNHAVLHPARDENGDAAFGCLRILASGFFPVLSTENPMCQTNKNRNEVVDPAEKQERGKQAKQSGQNRRGSATS